MSVYSTVSGVVSFDAVAADLFRQLPSWQWVDEPEFSHVERSDGSLVVSFDGGLLRNFGRFVHVDVFKASGVGAVSGVLTEDCADGCNIRTVSRFVGRVSLTGSGPCFFSPVPVRPAQLLSLPMGSDVFEVLVGTFEHDVEVLSGAASPAASVSPASVSPASASGGPAVLLSGFPATQWCWCGGVDGSTGDPVCRVGGVPFCRSDFWG